MCVQKVAKTNPNFSRQQDKFLLSLIRRENSDAFWLCACSTVAHNLSKVRMMLKFSANLGLRGSFCSAGPYLSHYHCGYELAIDSLQYSRQPGKHSETHTQHNTFRKLKSAYGNWIRASLAANYSTMVVSDTNEDLVESSQTIWALYGTTGFT